MTVETFERAAASAGFELDAGQRVVAERLARVDLRPGRGAYLWGPVGRGKTWLMDAYRAGLTVRRTRRVHFHEFFRQLHRSVHEVGIERASTGLLAGCDVLFFDEFHVHDIGDAALLTRLLSALEDCGVALVVTSNYPPDGLLPNPLFHDKFRPTIETLKRRLEVVELVGERDYRLGAPPQDGRFSSGRYLPGGTHPAPPHEHERTTVSPPSGRPVVARAVRGDLLWFDFGDLCECPVSPHDYLGLAAAHSRWVVSGVPPIGEAAPDGVQRFCTLVDVLYDRDVELTVLGADWRTPDLQDPPAVPDLARARSRLALLR
ncbi:cell division protein ZapE [Rhodococcus tukisamuensis]|uniref:Cell division protein ZapE n=1 Tax=Rhodococcus tukisamuensis TaxID=168276 RepID=A0A1G6NGW7_9NOCA|nr:cell division protein ZapE [Rhodococcus tukisamuensis]SDC66941.1 cell division protein ZapE [Rhodococcus tukisamuensis]